METKVNNKLNTSVDNILMISKEDEIINTNNSKSINKKFLNIILIIFILFILLFLYFYLIKSNKTKKNFFYFKEEKYSIDSQYEKISPKDEKYIYIPIVGTNDFHGGFFPEINEINYNGQNIKYKTGGLEYLAKYINILREEFGNNKVLYFDSGDQFFRSKETILFKGENIYEFLNTIGLNGTTLGNHEFLYERSYIKNRIKNANYPYLINNIKDIISNKYEGALGENHKSSQLYDIVLENNDIIKIGVIGMTMQVGVAKPFYNVGNRKTWENISFEDHYYNLEQESKKLRERGANAVILLSHFGIECYDVKETCKIKMYNKNIKQAECSHIGNSLLPNYIKNLKPGIIDAIIGGDTHNNVHHWINNIPIMITKGKTKYLNIMYLPFKKIDNKYILVNDEIKIEGPLPNCDKVFKGLNHCDIIKNGTDLYENKINYSYNKLTNYYWHGKKIESDSKTLPLFNKYYDLYNKVEQQKIGKIIGFNKAIKIEPNGDSLLGNLFMDIIKNITNTDISIANSWMFQSYLSPGDLSFIDFIRIIPYENHICTTELKGEEIKKIIKSVQQGKGKNGLQPTGGLKQIIKIKKNKEKEVIDIKLYLNNKIVDIDDDKIYNVSSNNLVLSEFCGKEFNEKVFVDIIKEKIKNGKVKCHEFNTHYEIMNYVKSNGIIDVIKDMDLSQKRIVFVNE